MLCDVICYSYRVFLYHYRTKLESQHAEAEHQQQEAIEGATGSEATAADTVAEMENLKIEDYKNKDTDMQTTMIEQTRQVTPTEISQSTILTTTLTSTSNKKPNKKPKKKMDNKNPVLSHNSKANKTATHLKKIPSENHQKGSSPPSRKRRGIKYKAFSKLTHFLGGFS